MDRRVRHIVLAASAAALTPAAAVAQSETVALSAGVYTAAQAAEGKDLFALRCSECHTEADFLDGYLESWAGATADGLFDWVQTNMPEDNPGLLAPAEYSAVLAYIFQINGVPSGNTAFPSGMSALSRIIIDVPQAPRPAVPTRRRPAR